MIPMLTPHHSLPRLHRILLRHLLLLLMINLRLLLVLPLHPQNQTLAHRNHHHLVLLRLVRLAV